MGSRTVGDAAMELAYAGFKVFPAHGVDGGRCTCQERRCTSAGKHPRTRRGLRDATSDPAEVTAWWGRWPDSNVALATGNGLLVVDVDGFDGKESLERLEHRPTASSTTGRGRHLFYAGDGPNRVGVFKGIDIRGSGGYVIVPPSRHANGATYEWVRPLTEGLPPAPYWSSSRTEAPSAEADVLPAAEVSIYFEGTRNERLFKDAASMRAIGMTQRELLAALTIRNLDRCRPPLDKADVARIAASAARFPPTRNSDKRLLALGLGPDATAVYVALQTYSDHRSECFPSLTTLASLVLRSRPTVVKAIKCLEEAGLLCVYRSGVRQVNRYRLL